MFDSIGWGEIFVIILAGLIIIGPERLPGVIMDVRAAIFAARRAINDAKNELYGEEFDEFRKPMSTVTEYAAMGPKRAIAKVLFDEEGDYLDQLDPRRMMDGDPVVGRNATSSAQGSSRVSQEPPPSRANHAGNADYANQTGGINQTGSYNQQGQAGNPTQPAPKRRRRQPGMGATSPQDTPPAPSSGGGFSWTDVT